MRQVYTECDKFTHLYTVSDNIERDEGDQALAEELRNDLAHPPEASNDDVISKLCCLAVARLQCLRCGDACQIIIW